MFVEWVYSRPRDKNGSIYSQINENKKGCNFKSHLAFVVIKNREHNEKRYFNLNLGGKYNWLMLVHFWKKLS